MTIAQKVTLALIKYEMFDAQFPDGFLDQITDEVLEEVFGIASKYDVSYIIGAALSKLGLLSGEAKAAFFNEQLACIYRSESITHELNSISELFEKNCIAFIPLKGSVIREFYPKPEMRTSCDIDVLIHKDDLQNAQNLLEETLNYTYFSECSHDIAFYSPSGVELELHFSLYEGDNYQKLLLDRVWEYANLKEGSKCCCELSKEFFMVYHIIHLYKHIKSGGCGLRPFLDLAILEHKFGYHKAAFDALIAEAGLTKFTQKIFDITHMWFGTMEHDQVSELMAEYIFGAGAYGSLENQVAQTQAKAGSKFKSILSRIFISRKELGVMYPMVQKCPALTPVYEVVRWCRIIFKDKAQKQLAIIKHNSTITSEKKQQVSDLFEHLGL